jgi:hypothetical protein
MRKIIVIECKNDDVKKSFEEEISREDIATILVMNPYLEEDEKVFEIQGFYSDEDIELFRKEIKEREKEYLE